jgi:ribonuclease D
VTRPQASPPILVAEHAALERLVAALAPEPVIALDTESNSFHVYKERVCLLQVSTPTGDWVVDPLSVDVRPLAAVLCDGRETVLHGADYDVRCLKREYGWRLPRLFDTMAAARRLGREALGLSALVEAQFGVRLSKTFQRSDWGRRPLTREQIAYASLDTRFLLPLRELLAGELTARGALDEARREFDRIAAVEPRDKVFDVEGWRRIREARSLDEVGRAILRALYLSREERARASDRPPFKVLAEQTMVEISRRRPRTLEELSAIPGVTPSILRRIGDAILEAVVATPPR